jgi:hypothetical protein
MKTYYKTNSPTVMAAIQAHETEATQVKLAGLAFADHFGGQLLVQNDIHGYRIAGLRFDPPKPVTIWTKPDRKNVMLQYPRVSGVKATAEEKAELVTIKKEWDERRPTQTADFAPVLAAMGTCWTNCIFNGGFTLFQHAGYVYVSTGTPLAECMQEIFTSEFEAARVAHKVAQLKA